MRDSTKHDLNHLFWFILTSLVICGLVSGSLFLPSVKPETAMEFVIMSPVFALVATQPLSAACVAVSRSHLKE